MQSTAHVPYGSRLGRIGMLAAVIAVTVVANLLSGVVLRGGAAPAPANSYRAMTPARLLDTRATGQTVDGQHRGVGALASGSTYRLQLGGRAGIPGVDVESVALNITLVGTPGATWATVWPAGRPRPLAANVNADRPGQTVGNLVIAGVAAGAVDIYVHAGPVHVVVDVQGYHLLNTYDPALTTTTTAAATTTAALPPSGQHPAIYLPGNHARLSAALNSPSASASRFRTMIDSRMATGFQTLFDSGISMWQFALLGQLTGNAAYCTKAVAGIEWFVAAEEARIAAYVPANRGTLPLVARDSYLDVGPLVGDVMMVFDWCHGSVSATQRGRWLAYADRAVWNVWNPTQATWAGKEAAWSGWSIDNPSNNYYYSFLKATMLLGLGARGELASAEGWVTHFRTTKIANQLVPTFNRDLAGGGSREGTGYGTAMMRLWEIYDLWHGSTGEQIAHLTPHTRASVVHTLHSIVPARNAVSLVGDHSRDSTGALFDYHRHYLQGAARLLGNDPLVADVTATLAASSVPRMQFQFMFVFDFLNDLGPGSGTPTLRTAYYGSGTGQVLWRSGWDAAATWLNVTAGPYTESHAHRDQGTFQLYRNGWLAMDPNYFSHSGIRQEEELHNIVRFSGSNGATIRQWEGSVSSVQALRNESAFTHIAVDTLPAYTLRGETRISRSQREMVMIGSDLLIVADRATSATGTTQTWQLNTPTAPTLSGDTATMTSNGVTMRVQRVGAGGSYTVTDWAPDADLSGGFRLNDTYAAGANVMFHVISLGTPTASPVASAVASTSAGRSGVTVTMADGRVITALFSATGVDGTLQITSGGSTLLDSTLLPGVGSLPER